MLLFENKDTISVVGMVSGTICTWTSVCLGSYLLDVTAMVGAVGDSVAGDIVGSRHPAHPQHTVGDHRKLNTHWRWERDCGEEICKLLLLLLFFFPGPM